MLEIIKDDQGVIKACLEYYIVDANGNFNRDGEYIWVNECEIAPQYRGNGILKHFAKKIMADVPHAKFGYFGRYKKYPKRGVRLYSKSRWEILIGNK